MKTDLREFSDLELSLLVFNDETLYQVRNDSKLYDLIDSKFLYTEQQLSVLKRDLRSEVLK